MASGVVNTTTTAGTASVVLPDTPTTTGLIRVSQTSNPVHFDVSDAFVTLAPAAITVTAPNTNVNWTVNSTRNITWSHNLGTSETMVIELSRDGGSTWVALGTAPPTTGNTSGTFSWLVTGPVTTTARVRVTWVRNSAVHDVSNANFRIQ